jgi:hypothetical protein
MVGIEVKTTRKEALTKLRIVEENTEAIKGESQARMEEVVARTRRSTRTIGVSAVQLPTSTEIGRGTSLL